MLLEAPLIIALHLEVDPFSDRVSHSCYYEHQALSRSPSPTRRKLLTTVLTTQTRVMLADTCTPRTHVPTVDVLGLSDDRGRGLSDDCGRGLSDDRGVFWLCTEGNIAAYLNAELFWW